MTSQSNILKEWLRICSSKLKTSLPSRFHHPWYWKKSKHAGDLRKTVLNSQICVDNFWKNVRESWAWKATKKYSIRILYISNMYTLRNARGLSMKRMMILEVITTKKELVDWLEQSRTSLLTRSFEGQRWSKQISKWNCCKVVNLVFNPP